ncbi:MAG: M20/M25/M40 family metallo-hydrolase [candidate division KSB1 bacterium]|nr:M20/M25/M40 family metallo-hydrolase [candidate division KSB1 bacterium]
MKRQLLVALVAGGLVLGPSFRSPKSAQPVLVVLSSADYPRLSDAVGFVPYYYDDAIVFGKVDSYALEALRVSGIAYHVVSEAGWHGDYYVVSAPPGAPQLVDVPKGRALCRLQGRTLVQATPDEALELARSGFSLQWISRLAKPTPPPAPVHLETRAGYDTTIARIIEKVSADTLHRWVQRLQDFRTRYTYSDSIRKAAQWIFDRYVALGCTEVEFDTFFVSGSTVPHLNVIATKRGLVYPDSVIMIGGHYDSIVLGSGTNPFVWAPGADDNASGAVMALEAARVLAEHNFEATVAFAAWDAEEIGLVGSEAYARKLYLSRRPVGFYLNGDMIGNYNPAAPPRDVTIFTDAPSAPYAELVADMCRTYTTLVPSIPGNSGGSDHRSFQVWGQRAIYVQEGDFSPHWHKVTDVTTNMDFLYMREVVQASIAAIAALAGPADNFGDVPYVKVSTFTLDDDATGQSYGNGNGFVDAGERLEIRLNVKNFGNRSGHGVFCRVRSGDPQVQVVKDSVYVGEVPPGAVVASQESAVIALSPLLPSGRKIQLQVDIRDDAGSVWSDLVKLTVTMPVFAYLAQNAQEKEGNGDGKIDPGENFSLAVTVKNDGLRHAMDVEAVLRSTSPYAVVTDSTAVYPAVAVGRAGSNRGDEFVVHVLPEAPSTIVPFQLELREGKGFCRTVLPIYVAIGQGRVLVVEDDGDFAVSDLYRSTMNRLGLCFRHWDTGLEGPVPLDTLQQYRRVIWYTGHYFGHSLYSSGTAALESYLGGGGSLFINGSMLTLSLRNSAFLRDWLRVAYVNHNTQLHRLTTQGSNPVLGSMQFWLSREGDNRQSLPNEVDPLSPGQAILYYDRATPEGPGVIRSSGAGAVAVDGGTYRAVFFGFGWEGIADGELRQLALQRVLDWLQGGVSGTDQKPASGNVPGAFVLEQNYPNPFNPHTLIRFALPRSARVEVRVLNTAGQVVRTMFRGPLNQGSHQLSWDGKDDTGVAVAGGIYLYQLVSEDVCLTRKCALVR